MAFRDYLRETASYFGVRNPLDLRASPLQESQSERLDRYQLNWAYYRNRMYDQELKAVLKGKAARRQYENLYAKIKPLFAVCPQVGDVDAAAVLAPPVVVTSDQSAIEAAIVDVWKRSQLQSRHGRAVLWGAVMGDVYFRVAGEDNAPRILAHSPQEMDVVYDPHDADRIEQAILSYNYYEPNGQRRTYTLRIYATHYETYRDGELFTYPDNPFDTPQWERTDPLAKLGIIPVVHLKLIDVGEVYGDSTFQPALPMLDAVNEIASQMADIIRINADPQMVAYHVKDGDLTKGETTKGQTNIWYLNTSAAAKAAGMDPRIELLEWTGNIQGATQFIDWCKGNIEELLPEWHLKRIREQANPSGYSVSLQLTELQIKLAGMRRQAVEALHTANAYAMVQMGKATDPGDVGHDIECGEILPRDEEREQRMAVIDMGQSVITRAEYLKRVGYDSDEIAKLLKEKDEEALERAAMFPDLSGQDTQPGDEDEDEEDEDQAKPKATGKPQPNPKVPRR